VIGSGTFGTLISPLMDFIALSNALYLSDRLIGESLALSSMLVRSPARCSNCREKRTEYVHSILLASCTFIELRRTAVSKNVNPLSPDIKIHILLTVLHTFLMELVRRICLIIKTTCPWGSLSSFSSLECLNNSDDVRRNFIFVTVS